MGFKQNKGITLVALVITVIVLIILAGVTIASIVGDDGIINRAKEGKQNMINATGEEDRKIQEMLNEMNAIAEEMGGTGKPEKPEEPDKPKPPEPPADETAPIVSIEVGAITENSIEVTVTATDLESGLAETETYQYYQNETEIIKSTSNTHVYSGLEAGTEYTLTVRVYDKAGNMGEASSTVTTISAGRKPEELYDGKNNPTEPGYNPDGMHIGDYVNYTAGVWTETKPTPTSSNPFEFGGYTEGKSRDTSTTGSYVSGEYGKGHGYEGWRLWDISADKKVLTLISAGCPEVYYHPYISNQSNLPYNTEKILTGSTKGTINSAYPSTPRNWNMYNNTSKYGSNARAMVKADLDVWYSRYINSQYTNSNDIPSFPANSANKLIGIVENGYYYWLSSAFNEFGVFYVDPSNRNVDARYVGNGLGRAHGVRMLVNLAPEVKFDAVPDKITQDGFEYNIWKIK